MFKKSLYTFLTVALVGSQTAFALDVRENARYFNGPTVSSITETGVTVSLPPLVLAGMTDTEKASVYFEYTEPGMMCIAIYPTPENCLPKKTEQGKTEVVLGNLKPNTTYSVSYKRDNAIRCITTPCPSNEFQSAVAEFTTKVKGAGTPTSTDNVPITANLWLGSRGAQVVTLQAVLIQQGYMTGSPTGYFGLITFKALKQFQKAHNISPTGFVGPHTRLVFAKMTVSQTATGVAETFEGTITAYSTQCFADGECSITVDGKKVVTTIGWSQKIVGKVLGIPDFGTIEKNIGAHAKVYAKKTEDGYTLYGNTDYYVHVTPVANRKLPGDSAVTSPSDVQGKTWVWQKTVTKDGTAVTPLKTDAFSVVFATDGALSGKTDCNSFFGTGTFGSDGFMKVGSLGSTRMFCDGSQEGVFTGALQDSERYSIDTSGSLVLTLSGNKGTMYFVKK